MRTSKYWQDGKFNIKLYHEDYYKKHPDYKKIFMRAWRKKKFYDKGMTAHGTKIKRMKNYS